MNQKCNIKTRAEARAEFRRIGKSIAAWAREHGVHRQTVYSVLEGKKKCERGDAHKVAVLLGIKDGVIVEEKRGGK